MPTCSDEADGSTPEYIVVGVGRERWVCIDGFVRAATNPLRSSSVMTDDCVDLSLTSFSLARVGMRGLNFLYGYVYIVD